MSDEQGQEQGSVRETAAAMPEKDKENLPQQVANLKENAAHAESMHKAKVNELNLEIKSTKKERDNLKEELDSAKNQKKQMQMEAVASSGIRDFVRNSLLDIMAGVDDAASVGKTRELTEGLLGYIPSVTSIGSDSSGGHQTERVEFDLAVTVLAKQVESEEQGGKVSAELKIATKLSILQAGVGGSAYSESSEARTGSSEHANRIRFSVPITYAIHNDSLDNE